MTNKMINSAQAPAAVGPFTFCLSGNTLYISGQLGLDPQSGEMKTTVEEQAKQAFINLGSILKEVEMTYDNVVKTTVFYNICLILAKLTKSMGITFQKFCLHVLV